MTFEELIAKGYAPLESSSCTGRNCGELIEWWLTPKGKRQPRDPGTNEPHWATCADAKQFSRPPKKKSVSSSS